jgi:hypothetical protein
MDSLQKNFGAILGKVAEFFTKPAINTLRGLAGQGRQFLCD